MLFSLAAPDHLLSSKLVPISAAFSDVPRRFDGSRCVPMPAKDWSKGDNIVHTGKPEWGSGQVLSAENFVHEGKPAQRLTIRFARAGTKTISTAFAELRPASDMPRMLETQEEEPDPLQKVALSANVEELMTTLPDRATDPFSSLKARLTATLDLYRFTESGGALLDWAAIQTGLKDPLSRFNRAELEQWFGKFKVELDNHLRKLTRDIRRQEPGLLEAAATGATPAARAALRRAEGR